MICFYYLKVNAFIINNLKKDGFIITLQQL